MKKFIVSTAAATVFAFGSAAIAQDGQLSYDLNAEVSSVCGAYNASGTEIDVDFGELAETATSNTVEQGAGDATYICNSPNGFSRTFTSANGGYLFRAGTNGGAQNQIAYEMRHQGSNGLNMNWTSLSSAASADLNGSAYLTGVTGAVSFRVDGVRGADEVNGAAGTTVFAGDYSDVVTITVTAK